MCCPQLCSHCGWLLLKCSAIGIGFNGAETNCRIAPILGILLMNSCNTDKFLATTIICSLSTLNWIEYLKINFLRCLHAETSSLRLFNVASSGLVMMKCFSAVHSWHLPVRFVYGFAFSRIFQPIVYRSFLLFSAQMYLLSSVLFLLFSLLKDVWWFLHLALKLVAVNST